MGELVKAVLRSLHNEEEDVELMFNPTEFTYDRSNTYAEAPIPGLTAPHLQFVRGDNRTLNIEIFLDGEETTLKVLALHKLIAIRSDTHAPSIVVFEWGSMAFRGVITQLQHRFTLFDENGEMIRARVTMSMKSYRTPQEQYEALSLESPDVTKAHIVEEGDRLDLIAEKEYGSSSLWRIIAKANDLDRPRALVPGTVLTIPAI